MRIHLIKKIIKHSIPVTNNIICLVAMCLVLFASTNLIQAERFVIVNEKGEKQEIIGRLHASGQGAFAIQRPGGQMELVAQGAVIERDNTIPFKAATPEEMSQQLSEEFGPGTFRSYTEGNFVIGLVLMDELPKRSEARAIIFMKKAAKFMNNVQKVFLKFATKMKLETTDPECPLVLLIFESDDAFDAYAESVTKGQGLSAGNISGFYNGLTNYLAIRMTECHTFEVPLHEAIHQQVFNQGVLTRLAPIPTWFNEGIAAGFEANSDRISAGPTKVHTRYAKMAATANQLTWSQLVVEDQAFRGDVLAGEAYCHAWCLHWLLVTKHAKQYSAYVKHLSEKQPFTKQDSTVREEEFVQFFGDDFTALKLQFNKAIQYSQRRQRKPPAQKPVGYMHSQRALADFELTAINRVDRGGVLEVEGRMRNINPFRSLSFSIAVVTDAGTYAQWILPAVASNRVVPLPKKYADKIAPGSSGGSSNSFRVRVRSILPDSKEAARWSRGDLPAPNEGR